jgi:hypothetical protein
MSLVYLAWNNLFQKMLERLLRFQLRAVPQQAAALNKGNFDIVGSFGTSWQK